MRLMSHNIINESDAELFILYLGGNCVSTRLFQLAMLAELAALCRLCITIEPIMCTHNPLVNIFGHDTLSKQIENILPTFTSVSGRLQVTALPLQSSRKTALQSEAQRSRLVRKRAACFLVLQCLMGYVFFICFSTNT